MFKSTKIFLSLFFVIMSSFPLIFCMEDSSNVEGSIEDEGNHILSLIANDESFNKSFDKCFNELLNRYCVEFNISREQANKMIIEDLAHANQPANDVDFASELPEIIGEELMVYAIPKLNGSFSEDYINMVLGTNIKIVKVPSPRFLMDLGQARCLSYLKKTISNNKAERSIVYAASQGTATALNNAAHEDKGTIKALILEGVLISGNSAIEYTVLGFIKKYFKITNIPFSYYWVPYFAKALFILYWPSGKQPIKDLDKISKELLIIIIHSKDDRQISYNDACALYYGLKSRGNNNTYFISKEGSWHINILDEIDEVKVLRSILNKHLSSEAGMSIQDVTSYQPDHQQFEKQYNDLLKKEKNHERLFLIMAVGAFCIILNMLIVYV